MSRALRVCSTIGCYEITAPGATRCAACLRELRARQEARREGKRKHDPRKRKRYDKTWEAFRKKHLSLYPYCVDCGKRADQVDHIIPIERGGARLDHANLASRCVSCHSRKTASEDGGFGNRGKNERRETGVRETQLTEVEKWINGGGV